MKLENVDIDVISDDLQKLYNNICHGEITRNDIESKLLDIIIEVQDLKQYIED